MTQAIFVDAVFGLSAIYLIYAIRKGHLVTRLKFGPFQEFYGNDARFFGKMLLVVLGLTILITGSNDPNIFKTRALLLGTTFAILAFLIIWGILSLKVSTMISTLIFLVSVLLLILLFLVFVI